MPRLRMSRRRAWARMRGTSDRGAVSATVAIVMGTGVLLGMATVVVDVGRLYAEREQLQGGADAAAWAVAEGCVNSPDTCEEQIAVALRYAAANAADRAAAVTVICGRGPGLPECPPAPDNRTACMGTAPDDGTYAEVRTETRLPDGTTLLPPTFAGALAGGEYDGTGVAACARVAWGPPRRTSGVAVTFSTCEWDELTDGGATVWPASPTPPATAERIVYLKDNDSPTCPAGPSGWDAPGGFGWLDDPDETCDATVEADGTFGGHTGNSVSQPCRTALSDARTDRSVLLFPIYDGVSGNGSHVTYHLAGFTSFVLTGYQFSGFSAASWLTGQTPCGGSQRCLSGYFTRGLVRDVGQIGGPDYGASIVNLIG